LVDYVNFTTKVKIICPKHGQFEQIPSSHLQGAGCRKCAIERNSKKQRLSQAEVINRAKETHGDKYDYSLVKYESFSTKIKIICPDHGIFEQTPANHLSGKRGCPSCKSESRGEKAINDVLDRLNVTFQREYTFDECRSINNYRLPFDFCVFLSKDLCLIEYDGKQHFEPFVLFGGQESFETLRQNDAIKDRFARENNIPLLRIPYYDFSNIEQIVTDWLASL
jgi:hypothetical protein